MPSVSSLRVLAAAPLAGALLALPLGLVTAPALLASSTSAGVLAVDASESPTAEPSRPPSTRPPIIPTTAPPTAEPTDEPTETAEPSREPSARATATRTRTRTSSPRPRRTTDAPVVRETPDGSLPVVTGGGFGVGSASPGLLDGTSDATGAPTTAPVAATSGDSGDTVTRLIQLVVSAGVLLGIGGGVGLYLTRT